MRMTIAQVCQPLAIRPPYIDGFAAGFVDVERLRVELLRKGDDLVPLDPLLADLLALRRP